MLPRQLPPPGADCTITLHLFLFNDLLVLAVPQAGNASTSGTAHSSSSSNSAGSGLSSTAIAAQLAASGLAGIGAMPTLTAPGSSSGAEHGERYRYYHQVSINDPIVVSACAPPQSAFGVASDVCFKVCGPCSLR